MPESFSYLDVMLRPVTPVIEEITLGGCNYPTSRFLKNELSKALKLHTLSFRGEITDKVVRLALGKVLENAENYSSLRWLKCPARQGTYKTGRGRNVRVHEHENPGEDEPVKACRKRDIRANVADVSKYEVEGAQKRAGFATLARRGW
ncbi:hypothetical protein BDY19DRAFT_1023176 [Irpex rosettiformis]|uniref:Uncharacterized protein n=1 Tax=Irpex rosettiformis TaxID=378272 RepID=A0ACB8TSC7_9APHY|nr:hypothetical protein BDY19DRAFT_1023176 [Irpex rosettiformis]